MRRLIPVLAVVLLGGCSVGGASPAPSASIGPTTPSPIPSSAVASPVPSASDSPGSTSSVPASPPSSMAPSPTFMTGAELVTVTDSLRVRSKPEVSTASARFEPTLPINTWLRVLAGPQAGSGYWWYRVALQEGVTLYGGAHEGWVAAGGHDGTPWLGYADVDPGRPLPVPQTGWPSIRRGDIVMSGETVRDPEQDMGGNLAVTVTMRGLLPGSSVDIFGNGTFRIAWVCNEPPVANASEPPLGWGVEDLGTTQGSAGEVAGRLRVDGKGTATTTLVLRPARPAQPCPAGHTGPWALSGEWGSLHVADPVHGLESTPERQSWETTF